MKVLITGISGLLGLNLALQLDKSFEVSGTYNRNSVTLPGIQTEQLDFSSRQPTQEFIQAVRPDVVIHTAALSNVEQCESDPELANLVNVVHSQFIASTANSIGARFVFISTDQLFTGDSSCMKECDEPSPINAYGRTKLLAEQQVLNACPGALVIRTNFFGWGSEIRASFSDWILQGLEREQRLTMFRDVFFTPILINDLVDVIGQLIHVNARGVLHVGGSQRLSKLAFAIELAEIFGHNPELLESISVSDFSFKAKRPNDMSLNVAKVEALLQNQMPTVTQGLKRLKSLRELGWADRLNLAGTHLPTVG